MLYLLNLRAHPSIKRLTPSLSAILHSLNAVSFFLLLEPKLLRHIHPSPYPPALNLVVASRSARPSASIVFVAFFPPFCLPFSHTYSSLQAHCLSKPDTLNSEEAPFGVPPRPSRFGLQPRHRQSKTLIQLVLSSAIRYEGHYSVYLGVSPRFRLRSAPHQNPYADAEGMGGLRSPASMLATQNLHSEPA